MYLAMSAISGPRSAPFMSSIVDRATAAAGVTGACASSGAPASSSALGCHDVGNSARRCVARFTSASEQ